MNTADWRVRTCTAVYFCDMTRHSSAMDSSTVGTAAVREVWVDTAKGIAIILVVLFHAIIFTDRVDLAWLWPVPAGILDTFRMPLFFFAAGLFASKALRLSFRDLTRTRLLRLVWLYVLWSFIWAVVFTFVHVPGSGGEAPLMQFLFILVLPNPSTWFVYGLALYFIAMWLMRRFPWWLQLSVGLAIALLFGTQTLTADNGALNKMGLYFLYFQLAVLSGAHARRLFAKTQWWHALLMITVYAAAVIPVAKYDLLTLPFVRIIASVLAITAGCAIAVVLSRRRAFSWLSYLGSRTLPIYVLHFYPILLFMTLIEVVAPELRWTAPAMPLALTIVAILVSLGVYALTKRLPGLYTEPAFLSALFAPRPASEPSVAPQNP